MSPEQQLIQQISHTVSGDHLDNRPLLEDYSDQFAELCRSINERLNRCNEYLNKGRRSEAVYELHSAPDLLELVSACSGEWLKKWKNVCLDLELTMFDAFDQAIVERLRKECVSEQELEPLLKEYRRCVYQGDHARCVELLRKIREKDPGNPSWIENLRPLEEAFLPSWIERAERGLLAKDLQDLKIVFQELNHPQRVVPVPEDLMKQLRRALLSERAVDLKTDGEMLLASVRKAMEAEDLEELGKLWEKSKALEEDEAFMNRPEAWEKILADSRVFAEKLTLRREKQGEYDQAVSRLKDKLMDGKTSMIELRHEYERLEAWGMPIPELLVKQVNETLAQRRADGRRRAMFISLSIVSVIVVLALVGGFVFYRYSVSARRGGYLAKAEQYFQNSQLDELEALLGEIQLEDSEYYGASELVGIREGLEQARRKQEVNRRSYAAFKATLEDIRKDDYRGDANAIRRVLEDAKAIAPDSEEKAYLVRWQNEWLKQSSVREEEMNVRYRPRLNGIQTALDGIKQASGEGLSAELSALEDVEREFGKLDSSQIAMCSETLQSQHSKLRSALTVRLSDVRRRQAEWTAQQEAEQRARRLQDVRLRKLRQDIRGALPNLARYETLLKEFIEKGVGAPELSDYQAVLGQLESYRGVLSLQGAFSSEQIMDSDTGKAVERLLSEESPASRSIWRGDLERVRRLHKMNQDMQRKSSTLIDLRKSRMYVMRIRRHGASEWTYLYGERPFQSQVKDGITYYWGNAFWAGDHESRSILTPTATINGGTNFDSTMYEVNLSRVRDDNLAPHIRLMRRLVSEAMRSQDVVLYLLDELDALRQDKELDPVQAVVIFKRFVNMLAMYGAEELPESKEWAELANAIDTDIPWQRGTHPKTLEVRGKIAAFWKEIPLLAPYRRRLEWNRRLLAAVLRTELRIIGSVHPEGEGKKVYVPCERGTEFWVFTPTGQGALSSFTVLDGEGGVLSIDALGKAGVGVPMFGPMPGRELLSIVDLLKAEDKELVKGIVYPQAWPGNCLVR